MFRLSDRIDAGRRAVSFETVDLHFIGRMLIPAWLGPKRFVMTAIAIGLAAEEFVSTLCGIGIEINAGTRPYGRQSELIEVQRRQFAGDLIGIGVGGDVAQASLRRDGELSCVVESFIEERSDPMSFIYGNKGVPVSPGSPSAGP